LAAGKWIDELTAEMPLPEAARVVFGVRLEVVREQLGLSLSQWDRDPEHVHQLRVGSRRSAAALKIFSACLPRKEYKKARQELKRLRKAAGAARDWDVFLLDLSKQIKDDSAHAHSGFELLLGYGVAQRLLAQEHLYEAVPEYPQPFDRFCDALLASVRSSKTRAATLGDLAGPVLLDLLTQLEDAVAQDLNDSEHLHQVRILGKRLRYAMEVFAPCFELDFRNVHYAAVEEMQEILGRANDSYVACGRLAFLRGKLRKLLPADWPRIQKDIETNLRFHQARLPRERVRFEEWWRDWQETGARAALVNMLQATTWVTDLGRY
jgi:CHAD domain-containing protein